MLLHVSLKEEPELFFDVTCEESDRSRLALKRLKKRSEYKKMNKY